MRNRPGTTQRIGWRSPSVAILGEVALRVRGWRWLTRQRRADLIVFLEDARAEIVRLEDLVSELEARR